MSFKPINAGKPQGGDFEQRNFPAPKAGSRKARVSLIVDLGIQEREDFEDPNTGEVKPQKPCQQVVVFADLVGDVVDYGGTIGEAPYRLMLNKSFQGKVQGINFTATPPKDAKGNTIAGKPWGLHPANLLTKLAKAVGREEIIPDSGPHGMDISRLLDQPFMAQVEVKKQEDKNGKKDKDGNVIVYTNVNYKGASEVPMVEDDDGEETPMKIGKLPLPARCITFDNAKAEDIKFIRANLIKMIKTAQNYSGSAMEKAIKEFEAANAGNEDHDEEQQEQEEAPAPKKPAAKPAAPKKPAKPAPNFDDMDDDIPF